MLTNIFQQTTWSEFTSNSELMKLYQQYSNQQIVVLNGNEMQTSWQFVLQIMKKFNYLNLTEFNDYLNVPIDGRKTYNKDQINDYLREIELYCEYRGLSALLILINNYEMILQAEYDQQYVANQFRSTVQECAENNYKVDVFAFINT